MRSSKTGHLVFALALAVAVPAAGQSVNPTSIGNSSGWASRFLPGDIWVRMMTRPDGTGAEGFTVAAPPDSVWAALTDVMKQLDVPISFTDRAAGEMGTLKTKAYKRFAKSAISEYLRCGEGMNGPNADTYMVYLSAAAMMKAGTDGTVRVLPVILGDAVDLPNGRNDVIPCTTSGRFEDRLEKAVRKRLGGK